MVMFLVYSIICSLNVVVEVKFDNVEKNGELMVFRVGC